jgi:CheY-like chemotaxis protein
MKPSKQPSKQPMGTPAGARVPRVLVVVRDDGIRDAVAAALAGEGYQVATLGHGPAALARIASWRPGVILLDLRLPSTDGGAALGGYRRAAGPRVAIRSRTPAAAASGWSPSGRRSRRRASGRPVAAEA